MQQIYNKLIILKPTDQMVYNRCNDMKKTSLFSKSLILMILLFIGSAPLMAQISEGEPYSRTIRTGNRPGSGDWGIFIGPSLTDIGSMVNREISWQGLPLVNIKHYYSDELELRCGIQLSKATDKSVGNLMDDDIEYESFYKESESYYRLTPGVAYHFSSKNILDVYVGASLPLGISGDKYINVFDGDNYGTQKRTSFEIGLGAFIGLQCFVADLPVAIGFEYGITGYKSLGEQYKNITTDENGAEQIFYTTSPSSDYQYSELKKSSGYLGSDIRFTISYFFN